MKVSTIALVVGALFCANGAFAAAVSTPPSPTDSVKAKKLLEGPEAAQKLQGQQDAVKKFGADKSARVMGSHDDSTAKINANKERREKERREKKSAPVEGGSPAQAA